VVISGLKCTIIHVVVDLIKDLGDLGDEVAPLHLELFTVISADEAHLLLLVVLFAQFQPNGGALKLPMVEFPPGVIVFAVIADRADAYRLQGLAKLGHLVQDGGCVVILIGNRDEDDLGLSHSGGDDETLVVTVDHDHGPDGSGGETPRGLPHELLLPGFILKPDIEHLGEVLAQLMRGSALNPTSIGGHIELNSCCVVGSGEFLDF